MGFGIGDIFGGIVNAGESLLGSVGQIAKEAAPIASLIGGPEFGLAASLLGAAGSPPSGSLGGPPNISSFLGGAFQGIQDALKTATGGSSGSGITGLPSSVNGTVDEVKQATQGLTNLQKDMALFSIQQTELQSLYAMLKDLGKNAAHNIA